MRRRTPTLASQATAAVSDTCGGMTVRCSYCVHGSSATSSSKLLHQPAWTAGAAPQRELTAQVYSPSPPLPAPVCGRCATAAKPVCPRGEQSVGGLWKVGGRGGAGASSSLLPLAPCGRMRASRAAFQLCAPCPPPSPLPQSPPRPAPCAPPAPPCAHQCVAR